LEKSVNPLRKTPYDLIAVYKGQMLINMDSQAPNKVFGEWAAGSGFFCVPTLIKPESRFGSSRFDFYIDTEERKIFVEVKGVTLESEGVVLFPDAPTQRGARHLRELAEAVREGYEAYVFFVIQMEDCRYFTPNDATDPAFASALRSAAAQGVRVKCLNCKVTENTLTAGEFVPVKMNG
jgi:sugar fermentation stimulation protein A